MRKFALDWLTLYVSFSKKIHQLFLKLVNFFTADISYEKNLPTWQFCDGDILGFLGENVTLLISNLQTTGMKMVTAWNHLEKLRIFIGEKKLPFFGSLQETPNQGVPIYHPSLGRISRSSPGFHTAQLPVSAAWPQDLCFRYPTSSVVEVWKWWGGEDMKNLELYSWESSQTPPRNSRPYSGYPRGLQYINYNGQLVVWGPVVWDSNRGTSK